MISSVSHSTTECSAKIVDDLNFSQVLEYHATCSLSEFNTSITTGSFKTNARQNIDYVTLANCWNISQDCARLTIYKTTQRGVRTFLHPSLSHRYPTNNRGLRYDRTNHPLLTDTLIAGTISKRGNKYAQVYGTRFEWARAHPMKLKSKTHETLPPEMVMDGSKEKNLGKFHQKLKDDCCYKHQTEPYFPWSNTAEGKIREVKKGSSRKTIKTGTPKCLWYHSIELEALIRFNMTLNTIFLTAKCPRCS